MQRQAVCLLAVAVIGLGITVATEALSQVNSPSDPPRPPSLKTVPVPEQTNLADFVSDRQAAIRLGKALFWEMQVGSDGVTACASCHFSSGMADNRSKNQLSPGLKRITATGATIRQAHDRAYAAAAEISWPGVHYRRDIAAQALT